MAAYARVNEYGFMETPYLKVKNGKVTDEVVYLDASQEVTEVIADAGAELDKDGKFVAERVHATKRSLP